MICPLEAMRPFLRHLPEQLVAHEAATAIENLSSTWPEGMSRFGVECRLDPDQPQVDVSLGYQWFDGGHERLETSLATHSSRHEPAWSTIRELCTLWTDPDSGLGVRLRGLWLEFDVDNGADSAQPPSVFVLFKKPDRKVEDRQGLFETDVGRVLKNLIGEPKASTLLSRVLAFDKALPGPARIAYIAAMLPRTDRPARVIASDVSAEAIAPFLDQIGWRTPTEKLERVLGEISPFMSSLSLELSEESGSRIDLEFRIEPSRRKEQWQIIFDGLHKLGLASAEKCEALQPWWGWRTLPIPGMEPYDLWTTINHVKVTCAESLPLVAKAYVVGILGIFPPDNEVIIL